MVTRSSGLRLGERPCSTRTTDEAAKLTPGSAERDLLRPQIAAAWNATTRPDTGPFPIMVRFYGAGDGDLGFRKAAQSRSTRVCRVELDTPRRGARYGSTTIRGGSVRARRPHDRPPSRPILPRRRRVPAAGHSLRSRACGSLGAGVAIDGLPEGAANARPLRAPRSTPPSDPTTSSRLRSAKSVRLDDVVRLVAALDIRDSLRPPRASEPARLGLVEVPPMTAGLR